MYTLHFTPSEIHNSAWTSDWSGTDFSHYKCKQDVSSILILATNLCPVICFYFAFFITQWKSCSSRFSNIYAKSGVFSSALQCYSASSQIISAHICCGGCSAPLAHGNASLPSCLSNATCALHFPQSHLIYPSSNLTLRIVWQGLFAFFFSLSYSFPAPKVSNF